MVEDCTRISVVIIVMLIPIQMTMEHQETPTIALIMIHQIMMIVIPLIQVVLIHSTLAAVAMIVSKKNYNIHGR